MLSRVEATIEADPLGAEQIIARSRRLMSGFAHHHDPELDLVRRPRPSYSILDDLAAAAEGFRMAAARLRLTNLLGVFARFWMVVWGFGLLIGLFNIFLPLIIFLVGCAVVLAGFWAIWQTVTFWFWYGMWRPDR